MNGRVAVISDIHGCVDEFEEMIETLDLRPGVDKFVSVGDVVDKGPDSIGAIRAVRRAERRFPGSLTVIGNHEAKWRKRLRRGEELPYGVDAKDLNVDDMAWLSKLPMFTRVKALNLFVVHAGLFPKLYAPTSEGGAGGLRDGDEVWGRDGWRSTELVGRLIYTRFVNDEGFTVGIKKEGPGSKHWTSVYAGQDGFAVAGHEPTREILRGPHAWAIDTGCVYGHKMTAVVFEAGKEPVVVEVQAKAAYSEKVTWHQDKMRGVQATYDEA